MPASRLLSLALLGGVLALTTGASAPALTPRFADELVVRGLRSPTSFAVLPDGRILVAELAGRVRVVAGRRLLRRPFLDISSRVNVSGERGLVAIAADPRVGRVPAVYLYYALQRRKGVSAEAPTSMRLSRFTASGRELTILGSFAHAGCAGAARKRDCIPADCACHVGGSIAFDAAGNLLLSTGDGASPNTVNRNALRAQDLDSLAGKLLRVTLSGAGIRRNPFWTGRRGDNRSKIWAYGLRNPFRFTVRPGSGMLVAGDVGWRHWEELDVVARGANLGWPCDEGYLSITRGELRRLRHV